LIGWLGGSAPGVATRNLNSFLQGMREHGHEDGKNIDIVYRWADGDASRLPALAKELVGLNPNVIVSAASNANPILRQETTTIPIVGALIADPIKLGLAESFNHPGRNVTGILVTLDGLPGKQAGLLLELTPKASSIGVLVNPAGATSPIMIRDIEAAIRGTPIRLAPIEVRTASDLNAAFERLKHDGVEGLVVPQDPLFFTVAEQIISLAAVARLPAIYGIRQHVEEGGLMSYGINFPQNFRRAAYFVDRILKGSRAGDLPIELATKLELVINLKTAKALGLEVPAKLLFTADEVIE
jgi:putative ABC transport system substrate-binding protein